MYRSFYNLKAKPFQISTDPRFLWLGEKHREALATLKYGVLDNKGFLLITGDVGTGKTTLINALVNSFGKKIIYATISDPGLENLDFFRYIAHVFGFKKDFKNKGDFLIHLGRFLLHAYRSRKTVVLIIDEAQLLTQEMLEQIRLLSNIEKQQRKLINIFFVGQNEFNDILLKHENRALRQRITINYNIEPLSLTETGEYIQYRLQKAGAVAKIFKTGAIKQIYTFSKGYPRLINIICDHALLTGYVKEVRHIDAKIIKECVKDLKINEKAIYRQGLKAKRRPTGASRPPGPANQYRRERSLAYLILLALLVIVTSLIVKMQSSTVGLTTALHKLETLITARDRPGAVVYENATVPQSGRRKIKNATANNLIQNPDKGAQHLAPQGRTETGWEEQRPPEPARSAETIEKTAPSRTASSSEASPVSSEGSSAGESEHGTIFKKKGAVPLEKPAMDPIARAREFIARTGGKYTIHFSYNSNEISKTEFARLDELADIAAGTPQVMVIVTGHTDTSGSAAYNQKLSKFRANIVKSYFVGKGVRPENVISIGRGPEAPLVKSAPGIRSMSNRRVEIEMKLVR